MKFIKYIIYRIRLYFHQRKQLKKLNKKDPFIYK